MNFNEFHKPAGVKQDTLDARPAAKARRFSSACTGREQNGTTQTRITQPSAFRLSGGEQLFDGIWLYHKLYLVGIGHRVDCHNGYKVKS